MKFTCDKDALHDAVAAACRVVTAKSVAQGLLLELTEDKLAVTGTDVDITIASDVDVHGAASGSASVPGRLLSDIIKSLEPGTVDVSVEDRSFNMAASRSRFTLRTLPTEDFPKVAEPAGTTTTVDGAAFLTGLRQVLPAASEDFSRPVLGGVLLEPLPDGLRLVTTDSYRLARREIRGATIDIADKGILVPAPALNEVTRLIGDDDDVEVRVDENAVRFTVGRTRLHARLISGDFPSYEGLLPTDHPNRLTIDRTKLLDAIRRVRVMARDVTPLNVALNTDGITLTATTVDVGEATEHIAASYEGEDATIAFKAAYFHDGVEAQTANDIVLSLRGAIQPALLTAADDDGGYLYLLMPLRTTS